MIFTPVSHTHGAPVHGMEVERTPARQRSRDFPACRGRQVRSTAGAWAGSALDPRTGKQCSRVRGRCDLPVPGPVSIMVPPLHPSCACDSIQRHRLLLRFIPLLPANANVHLSIPANFCCGSRFLTSSPRDRGAASTATRVADTPPPMPCSAIRTLSSRASQNPEITSTANTNPIAT